MLIVRKPVRRFNTDNGWTRICAVLVSFSILASEFAAAQGLGGLPGQPSTEPQTQQRQQNIPPGGAGQQPGPQVGLGQQLFPQAIQEQMFASPFSFQGGTEPQYGPQVGPPQPVFPQGETRQQFGFQAGPGQQIIPQR